MTSKNWTTLFESYKGQWVALKDDEVTVIAHDKVAAKVLEKAANNGFEKPILFRIPTKTMTYIGLV